LTPFLPSEKRSISSSSANDSSAGFSEALQVSLFFRPWKRRRRQIGTPRFCSGLSTLVILGKTLEILHHLSFVSEGNDIEYIWHLEQRTFALWPEPWSHPGKFGQTGGAGDNHGGRPLRTIYDIMKKGEKNQG